MTAIIQRIRRKRKVSSELDSRWGDMAISPPNEGSWSQYGISPRVSPTSSEHGGQKQSPARPELFRNISMDRSEHRNELSLTSSLNMPTGYYDAKLQRQKTTTGPPEAQLAQPKPITLPKSWENQKFAGCSADEAEDNVSALGSPRGRRGTDDANSRGSKSPPLSVTSRMRRASGQSTVTDPMFSVPGTASSQRTSFSADDPRLAQQTPQHAKKPPPSTKVHHSEPVAAPQSLVPSYDDLYG
ncbi:hypothetical protein BDV18DRAFT_162066 [Aspergillus unguis]